MLLGVAAVLLGPLGALRAGTAVADDRAVVRGARVVGQLAMLLLAGRLALCLERMDVVLARVVTLCATKRRVSLVGAFGYKNSLRESDLSTRARFRGSD